jgi:hypothetical protein
MKTCWRSLGAASLGVLTAMEVACAHAPASADAQRALKNPDSERILVTGSHIPQRINPDSRPPTTISPVRVYSREEIDRTGRQYDIRAALSDLDLSVSR